MAPPSVPSWVLGIAVGAAVGALISAVLSVPPARPVRSAEDVWRDTWGTVGAGPPPSVAAGAAAGAGARDGARGGAKGGAGAGIGAGGGAGAGEEEAEEAALMREQLSRNHAFFGEDGQGAIGQAMVVVVGLGGVGSHAAHMLGRGGVGRLRLVDFDQVTLSSLNRHATAVRADVGTNKAEAMRRFLHGVRPRATIEAVQEMFTAESADRILVGPDGRVPDYVLDCIDNFETKVELICQCLKRGIRVLVSAGAGGRADPTRVRIAGFDESRNDPLMRRVRNELKTRRGVDPAEASFDVCFTTEKPRSALVWNCGDAEENPHEFQTVPGFRVRTIPVLGTLPAIFGQSMATHVLLHLADFPYTPEPIIDLRLKKLTTILQRAAEREQRILGGGGVPQRGKGELDYGMITEEDASVLIRDVWCGRCAVTGVTGLLTIIRWDITKPLHPLNAVILTKQQADLHIAEGGRDRLDPATCARIQERIDKYGGFYFGDIPKNL